MLGLRRWRPPITSFLEWILALTGLAAMILMAADWISVPLPHAAAKKTAISRTWVFLCPDESSYVVHATEAEAWVFRPGSSLRLKAVAGAMLLRYGQGDVQLVIEGDNGRLSEPDKETFTCRNDNRRAIWEHAKLDGVDFRGVGNEPPWVLEMREMSRIVLITEYGANRIERPLPEPVSDNVRNITRWDAGDLQVEVTAGVCHDSMSDEVMSSQVIIYWQGKVLRGCGRPLH